MKKVYLMSLALALLEPTVGHGAEEAGVVATMEEVVVTATKTEEARKDVLNSVVLKDRVDIQESTARSVGELLANEPGIDWRTRGNYGGAAEEIHIRGMQADETQVLVNGVSINSPSNGNANLNGVPLNSIDRIEVVKGSGSLLYGSGAIAGTVNIITKHPERDQLDLAVKTGYGSDDTYEVAFEQGMFLPGTDMGYYLTAGFKETDGSRDNSDLDHKDISLNLVLDKGDILGVSLYGDHLDREYGRPGIDPPAGFTSHFSAAGLQFYSSDAASTLDRGGDEDSHLNLQVKSSPASWVTLVARANYSALENYSYARYNGSFSGNLAEEGRESWVINEVAGFEGNAEVSPFSGATLLFGLDYKDHDWNTENIDLDTSGDAKSGVETNQAKLHTKGFFGEVQYRPVDFFKIQAGIRREEHSTFGTENLPLYGLIINPLPGTALKVSRGKHFKAPTPNDLYWPETAWARGNPDLKPQTGWHTDVTLEQSLPDEGLFLTLSCFKWDVDDKIDWAPNPLLGNKWTPSNLNKSEGRGVELGARYSPIVDLTLDVSYSHTRATDISPTVSRDARYVPEHRYKGGITWRKDSGLTVAVTLRSVSKRYFYRAKTDRFPTDVLGSYETLDLSVEQRWRDNWLLRFAADNIFDQEYSTYVSDFRDNTGTKYWGQYPGAGRSLYVSLGYEF